MRFVCSHCGHAGDATVLPEACPKCGAPAEDFWAMEEDVAAALRARPAHRAWWRPLARALGIAAVLCLIATPIGPEGWPSAIGFQSGDGTSPNGDTDSAQSGSADAEDLSARGGEPSTALIPEATTALSRPPAQGDQNGSLAAAPPPTQSDGSGPPPGIPDGSTDTGAPLDAAYPPPPAAPPGGGSGSGAAAGAGSSEAEEKETKSCPGLDNPKRGIVFIVDGSVSMGLPLDVPVATERQLDARIDIGDRSARAAYRALLASTEPKRLDFAKRIFTAAIGRIPASVTAGIVTFRSCTTVETLGPVEHDGFPDLARHVGGLQIERGGETAITQSLHAGRELLKPAGGRLVLVTDGQETCRADPCAEHGDAAADGVVIDIVDLTGAASLECLAEATGGTVYNARGTLDATSVVGFLHDRIDRACAQ